MKKCLLLILSIVVLLTSFALIFIKPGMLKKDYIDVPIEEIIANCSFEVEDEESFFVYDYTKNNAESFNEVVLSEKIEDLLFLIKLNDSDRFCGIFTNSISLLDSNYTLLKQLSTSFRPIEAYETSEGIVIRDEDGHMYIISKDFTKIKRIDIEIERNTKIYTNGKKIAYQLNDSIILFDGNEIKEIHIPQGYTFNGFIGEDCFLISKTVFKSLLRFKCIDINSLHVVKSSSFIFHPSVTYISALSSEYSAIVFAVNDSGTPIALYLNFGINKYTILDVYLDCLNYIQLL